MPQQSYFELIDAMWFQKLSQGGFRWCWTFGDGSSGCGVRGVRCYGVVCVEVLEMNLGEEVFAIV